MFLAIPFPTGPQPADIFGGGQNDCKFVVPRAEKIVEIGKELPGKSYMLAGNLSAASQAKSNNTLRIASKPQNGLYVLYFLAESPCQYLALWRNAYAYLTVVVSCSCWSRAGLPVSHFWSQILKFWLFFIFFLVGTAWLWKDIVWAASSLQIFSDESLTMQGAKNITNILLLP